MRYYYPCKPNRIAPDSPFFTELDNDIRWIAEVKKNGWRCLAQKDGMELTLMTRHNTLIVEPLAELRKTLFEMMPDRTVVDGELINNRTKDIKGVYYIFDILVHDGELLFELPLEKRRVILERIVYRGVPSIELAEQFRLGKKTLYAKVIAESEVNEGIVIKKLDSRYVASPARCQQHPHWLKVKRPEKHLFQK